jgi:hypothetical protein
MLEGVDRRGNTQLIQKTFLHDKPKKEGQGSHSALQIEDPKYQRIIKKTFEYLKQGMRSNEILATLMVEDNSMTETKFDRILQFTYQYADNELQKDREYLFQLHMDRYEKLYEQCMTMNDSWHRPLDPIKDWAIMVMKFKAALKALKAKEDLLGLHDKSMMLEFTNHQAVVVERETLRGGANKVGGYDLELLTDDELVELVELIKVTRTVPLEGVQRIIVKQTKIEIDINGNRSQHEEIQSTDDVNSVVVYEDMPEQVFDKFEDVTVDPDRILPLDEKNVKDDVPIELRGKPKVELVDLQDRLKKQSLEQLKQRLKRSKG